MRNTSTRYNNVNISGTLGIVKGISEDGGLFLPQEFPKIDINDFKNLRYQEIAKKVLGLYFPEIPYED